MGRVQLENWSTISTLIMHYFKQKIIFTVSIVCSNLQQALQIHQRKDIPPCLDRSQEQRVSLHGSYAQSWQDVLGEWWQLVCVGVLVDYSYDKTVYCYKLLATSNYSLNHLFLLNAFITLSTKLAHEMSL